jgi:spore maturation protein CgeB
MHRKQATGLRKSVNDKIVPKLATLVVTRKWCKLFSQVLRTEKEIDGVILIGVPLNQFEGLAAYIKNEFNCPLVYYDLDVPTSLPEYGGFSFDYYKGTNLEKYDAVIVPSEGVSDELSKYGARKIFYVHFAIDPDLYLPIKIEQDIDVFFYGTSDSDREKSVSVMISEPSREMERRFVVSGIKFNANLGNAQKIPMLPFSLWRYHAGRSKINLNIPRKRHASTYATSTSRPFELAAMECAIVSSPYNGLQKWFDVGKEVFVAKDSKEAIELYTWLLADGELRREIGLKARTKVLRQHTFRHRARKIIEILRELP